MKSINLKLAQEKGLISNNHLLYQELSKKYKYLLEYYLNSLIDFQKYEMMIDNNNLYIGKTNKYHNLNEYLKLNYLFLINNLFIEKLEPNDLALLHQFNPDNISNELLEMIKRTYQDVIKDNYFKGEYTNKIYKVCYGKMVPTNLVNNNTLVFRFYYGKNLINLDGDEFIKLNNKQEELIQTTINLLENEILNKTGINCEVLVQKDIN